MKKLKLNALELGATEMLTREQLKNVLGGLSGASGTNCSTTCPGGGTVSITDCNGTCTASSSGVTCQGSSATLTKNC